MEIHSWNIAVGLTYIDTRHGNKLEYIYTADLNYIYTRHGLYWNISYMDYISSRTRNNNYDEFVAG